MNSEKYTTFTAGINDSGRRADRIIRQFLPERSLGGLYKAFRKGLIRLNGKKTKPDSKVQEGDSIEIYKALLNDVSNEESRKDLMAKQTNGLPVLFEDDDLLALNKPAGLLVHGGTDSLEEQVRNYLIGKLPESLSFKPGPLHRLDRNTSGLIFFSKSLKGAKEFSSALQSGAFTKFYMALVDGKLKNKVVWVDNLQRNGKKKTSSVEEEGDRASTAFIPVRVEGNHTLVLAVIETGRTHQIRTQAAHHGYPLTGDSKYGGSPLKSGYILHSLAIRSAEEEKLPILMGIEAPLPEKAQKRLLSFFRNSTMEELNSDIKKILEDQ